MSQEEKQLQELEEVMPGVEIDKELHDRLKDRIAQKNEEKILDVLEKIRYHKNMIEDLKEELNHLTELS